MSFIIESKYIDAPFKVSTCIIVVYIILKIPMRFFKNNLTYENQYIFQIAFTLIFLVSIIITGYLHMQSIKKALSKKQRQHIGIYVSIYTLLMGAVVVIASRGHIIILDVLITAVINFFVVYFLINIGCKLGTKKDK
ncbi:MAG: hypothetical protein KAR87_00070 [Candidatus Aenigmarchaeota archaeon]|nr:hypothetical protein [Candidatus Aenigmarchaeota archaeon]